MPAKDLGNKFICYKCASKFYDLKKPEPVCPKCKADQRESPALKPQSEPKRGRLSAVPKTALRPEPEEPEVAAEAEEEELEAFEDEEVEIPEEEP